MNIAISFLGAAGTVTGSKYLIEADDRKILVDCGLFQGFKQLRLRNWRPLPFDPSSIDAVILTHAHLDHSGYLPLLVKNGFTGAIYSTLATKDLCSILLPDSGHLQERDAEFANRHAFSKHQPAEPLYTQKDAENALRQFEPVAFNQDFKLSKEMRVSFLQAGHILGAAIVKIVIARETIIFSGDLGRPHDATMVDPAGVSDADILVVESTYGDRTHDKKDPEEILAEIITRTSARGGTILIPSFAVGRSQTLLYHLYKLKQEKRIPDLPIFLDSPMAINASELFCRHADDHRLTADECRAVCDVAEYVRQSEGSKALDSNRVPKVIISASGMATGGRILHHLKEYAPDDRNTILFAGFQAGGTRGAKMVAGADTVKIHGAYIPVRAEVDNLHMLSAHADANEILSWLRAFKEPPRRTFVTHGEPAAADALRMRIKEEFGWHCEVPAYRDRVELF